MRRRTFTTFPFNLMAESPPPAKDSEYVLVHIDTETTGLDPSFHELIDIGVIYSDAAGRELGRWYRKVMPRHPDRLDPGAQKVNGFDAALWKKLGAWDPARALDDWIRYDRQHFGTRPRLRLAYNCAFDKAFLDALFKSHARQWDPHFVYFWFDIPSMAWALGHRQIRGPWVAESLGVTDEPHGGVDHTGITGAEVNLRIYRELMRRR